MSGQSLYSYVWNNPTNLTDPSGFETKTDDKKNVTTICLGCAAGGKDLLINPDGSTLVGSWDGDKAGTSGTFTGVAGDSTNKTQMSSQGGSGGATSASAIYRKTAADLRELANTKSHWWYIFNDPREQYAQQAHEYETWADALDGDKTAMAMIALSFAADVAVAKATHTAGGGACGCCFAGTTPVAVEGGAVRIDQIKVGQRVYARDPKTGKIKLKRVTRVFVIHGKQLYELITEDANHAQSITEVTDNHPYWVKGKGWVESAKLAPGMVLESLKQGDLIVVNVKPTGRVQTTYNLRVAGYHTFFAGTQLVYVHNAGGGGCGCRKAGVPGSEFVPNENVTKPYTRPTGAGPTAAQKASVQGKPCVDCGALTAKQVADHIDPLIVQHYREGQVNVQQQRSVDAVQPHCPACSASQGGQLRAFSERVKKALGLE